MLHNVNKKEERQNRLHPCEKAILVRRHLSRQRLWTFVINTTSVFNARDLMPNLRTSNFSRGTVTLRRL